MTEKPEFLEPDVVLFMHDQALREYGGTQGVKSEGLLHSALARPENRWHYAESEAPDMATVAGRMIWNCWPHNLEPKNQPLSPLLKLV